MEYNYPNRRRILKMISTGTVSGLLTQQTGSAQEQKQGQSKNKSRKRQGNQSSPPPGPAILHKEPANAPQFENTGIWQAEPIKVCGTDAYVDGEYLAQDFILDDHGANTAEAEVPPKLSPRFTEGALPPNLEDRGQPKTTGDLVYPTDSESYAGNAADILEFRAKPVDGGIAYRITLNTMVEPDVAGIAIGIKTDQNPSKGTDQWGYGIGTLGHLGLDHVLVTWGTGAELDGESVPASVDIERNQIEVTVPLEPEDETWRHYLVSGLFDAENRQFKKVQPLPDETSPGGAKGGNPPPIFNVGFRSRKQEPMGMPNIEPETLEKQVDEATHTGEIGQHFGVGYGRWREHKQAKALEARDISKLHADIDFAKLNSGTTTYNVPDTGYLTRLFASHHDLGEGVGIIKNKSAWLGKIQPYAMYIPSEYNPDEPTPLVVYLHGGNGNHHYTHLHPNFRRQLGEQPGAIILIPEGRGPFGYYKDEAELDVFESMADVMNLHNIDHDKISLTGYSMGGTGTLKLAAQYPDLFANAFTIAAGPDDNHPPYDPKRVNDNLRHVPLLWWHGTNDWAFPLPTVVDFTEQLRNKGYQYELDIFPGYEHLTFAFDDQWDGVSAFLQDNDVKKKPSHITYRAVPEFDNKRFGLIHNKAYWISNIQPSDNAPSGLVNIRSEAFGEASPITANFHGKGTEPKPHIKRGTRWKVPGMQPSKQNAFDINLEDVDAVTIWVEEANINVKESIRLNVNSTNPAMIRLVSSTNIKNVHVPAGSTERTITMN